MNNGFRLKFHCGPPSFWSILDYQVTSKNTNSWLADEAFSNN